MKISATTTARIVRTLIVIAYTAAVVIIPTIIGSHLSFMFAPEPDSFGHTLANWAIGVVTLIVFVFVIGGIIGLIRAVINYIKYGN